MSKDAVDEYTFGTIEGGFHYPQDWSYKVQNFSAIRYNRKLGAGEEATFMYPFMAAELAGGRSYGLQINLHYQADSSELLDQIYGLIVTTSIKYVKSNS